MPSIGSLFYTLGIRDLTDADLQKINAKLKNLGSEIQLTPKILKDLTQLAVPKGVKIELDPTIKDENLRRAVEGKVMRVEVQPLIGTLRTALRAATRETPLEAEIGPNATKLRSLIENVLNRQGFMLNISTVNDNYSKAVQAKLNGTTYKVKIHADAREITRSVEASLMQMQSRYFGLKISKDILYRSIDEALSGHKFPITVYVKTENARNAVQTALNKASGMSTQDILNHQRLMKAEAAAAAAELNRVKAANFGAANAAKAHTSASISLGGAMGSNIKIAGELGAAMASLYSVHAITEFLSKVIEIGGALEHQKIAMNTIFGDKGKTNELFGEIKGLARQSPLGVMELTKSVKALSAYGVQYNEIYDTAKRLADISAATSVDINRLILAFGKTKSRTFLDGLEAKQFAYANIPIYDMLSKKLTELEGKFVSVKDVMGRIKKREIGFELVKEVLWDLTDAGGKFYNMQEELAGSVKTSWKLVRDNIELMFGEIADSWVGSGLKDVGQVLQKLTREWRMISAVIGSAAAMMGVAKIATIALNQAVQKSTATTTANIFAQKKLQADHLMRAGLVRKLTASEKELIATRNRLTAEDLKGALADKQLNAYNLQQLYVTKQLTKAEIERLYAMGAIDATTKKMILSTSRLKVTMVSLLGAVKSGFMSALKYIFNWGTAVMGAVAGIVYLAERYREQSAKAEEIGKNIFTKATEGAKNLKDTVDSIKPPKGLSVLELSQGIEKMENAIKDYSATPIDDINNSLVAQDGHVLSLTERYEVLKTKVDELLASYEKMGDVGDSEDYRNIITASLPKGTLVTDGLLKDAEDYTKTLKKRDDSITTMLKSHGEAIRRDLKIAIDNDKDFEKVSEKLTTDAARFSELVKHPELYENALNSLPSGSKILQTINWTKKELASDKNEFISEISDFAESLKINVEKVWKTPFEDLDTVQKNAIALMVKSMFDQADGVSEQVKREGADFIDKVLNINSGFKIDAGKAFSEFISKDLDKLVGENIADKIRKGLTLSDSEMKTFREAMYNAYKAMFDAADEEMRKVMAERYETKFNFDNWQKWGFSIDDQQLANDVIANAISGKTTTTNTDDKGDQGDPFADKLKQRFKDIKDAWSEFQKWSKTEGREAAATRIGESGLFSTLTADQIPKTIEDYRALVKSIEDELRKAGVKGTKRESLLNELLKQLLDIDKTVVDEQLKFALDTVTKEAERQLADWNLFDKIRKATGNQDLAMSVAFGMNADAETDYPALVKKQFNEVAKAANSTLTFDTATPEFLKDAPEEVQKAWQDATKKLTQYAREQKDAIADILNEYQSLSDKLAKIDADRERKITTVNQSDMSDVDKAKYIQRINVEADYQKFTQSADYLKFFSGIYSLTMQQAQQIGDKIRYHLDERLQAGKISAEEYYKEIERINQQLSKLRNVKSNALTFMTSGVKGLQDKKLEKADSDILAQMSKVEEAEEELAKAKAEGNESDIAAAELSLKFAKQGLQAYEAIRDAIVKDQEKWQKVADIMNVAANIASGISDAFNSIRDMADALGFDSESNDWLNVGGVVDTLSSVTSGISKAIQSAMSGDIGGILSGVVSTITSPFTIWAEIHDKKLQQMIERSKEYSEQLQSINDAIERRMANFLGNAANMSVDQAENDIKKLEALSNMSKRDWMVAAITKKERDALSKRQAAYEEGGAYGYQRQLMTEQLTELERQRQAEIDKKKTDDSIVRDFDNQIDEMKIQIRDFAIEVAKDLYGIDLNSWAEQLGDALVDAFAAGEDAAEAFDKTVGDIMRDVTSKMISQDILAPMFGDLRNYLFGKDGTGGAFGSDFQLDPSEMGAMKEYLDKIKNEGIPAAQDLFDAINKATGGMLNDTEKSKSGMTKGLQSLTENTGDLIASYINGIRGDTSVIRLNWDKLMESTLPQMNVIAEAQLTAQRQIVENTLRNAMAAELIVQYSKSIDDRLRRAQADRSTGFWFK